VAEQITRLGQEIDTLTQAIAAHAKANPLCGVLGGIPGFVPARTPAAAKQNWDGSARPAM
jgi:hypothetical protein